MALAVIGDDGELPSVGINTRCRTSRQHRKALGYVLARGQFLVSLATAAKSPVDDRHASPPWCIAVPRRLSTLEVGHAVTAHSLTLVAAGHDSAVDVHDVAGHPAGVVREQVYDGVGNVAGGADASEWLERVEAVQRLLDLVFRDKALI
jgi:hypothetical protein